MPKAFFQTIYQDIKQSIESGLFSYQSLLMSENDLCHQYGCSRSTVRRALSELTAGGYVQPIQGKGVRVIWRPETDDDNMAFSMGGLESFHMCAERMGFKQSTEVRAFEHRIVDEACSRTTGFSVGTPIYYIDRVRSADDVPVSHEFSYLLESEAPGLTAQDAAGSLYSYIENLGTCIGIGKRTITVEDSISTPTASCSNTPKSAITRTFSPCARWRQDPTATTATATAASHQSGQRDNETPHPGIDCTAAPARRRIRQTQPSRKGKSNGSVRQVQEEERARRGTRPSGGCTLDDARARSQGARGGQSHRDVRGSRSRVLWEGLGQGLSHLAPGRHSGGSRGRSRDRRHGSRRGILLCRRCRDPRPHRYGHDLSRWQGLRRTRE